MLADEMQAAELVPIDRFLHLSMDKATINGAVAEFGVWNGHTIARLASHFKGQIVWGFDTFTGLPFPWRRSETSVYHAGHFDKQGKMPDVPCNVRLISGVFSETLKQWENIEPMRFVHIDSDLYESARDVLTLLNPRIVAGTVIAFDEIGNFERGAYDAWECGEYLALSEWLDECGRTVEFLYRTNENQASISVRR